MQRIHTLLLLAVIVAASAPARGQADGLEREAVKMTAEFAEEDREFASERAEANRDLEDALEQYLAQLRAANDELEARRARLDEELTEETTELADALEMRYKRIYAVNAALRLEVARLAEQLTSELQEIEDDFSEEVAEIDDNLTAALAKRIEAQDRYYRTFDEAKANLSTDLRDYRGELDEAQQERIEEQVEAVEEYGEEIKKETSPD